ncbi:hypothetical protein E8E13_010825 [Curvularia kusanoi]|uniref:Uncharacterized protein n=1 Tax=Curvularia kusanoi TaxID=90978 RepID=A0A9P4WCL2_CURKU|nr:hypothetical protein E8E13_010825 [Curvularia kusanoi]
MFDSADTHNIGTYKATRPSHCPHSICKDGSSAIYSLQPRDSDSPGILPPPVNTPVAPFGYESGPMKRLSESQLKSTHDFGDAAFPDEDGMPQAPFGDLPLRDVNSSSWSDRDAPFGLYERRDELEETIRRQQQALLAHRAIVDQLEHDIEYFEEELERVETQIVRYRQAWHLEKLNGIAASAARRKGGCRRQVQSAIHAEDEASVPHTEPPRGTAAASTWLPLTEAGPSRPARLEIHNLAELERREKEQTCCLAHLSERSESSHTLSGLYSPGDESRSDIISLSSSNNETDEVQRMGSEKRKVDKDTERLLAECRARYEQTRDGLESADDNDMIQAGNDLGMSWKGKGKEL